MIARSAILAAVILSGGLYGTHAAGRERPARRVSLASMPRTLGHWRAVSDTPLDPESLGVLGVDDYLNREYVDASGRPVSLYIGYYASQRQGETIHSPQNCLPGSGWQPVEASRTSLAVDGRSVPLNRYVIERAGERQLAYYWYEGRGRVIANEYLNKFWLMVDAARLHRSNGALVRVMTPIAPGVPADSGDGPAGEFVRHLFPQLPSYLP